MTRCSCHPNNSPLTAYLSKKCRSLEAKLAWADCCKRSRIKRKKEGFDYERASLRIKKRSFRRAWRRWRGYSVIQAIKQEEGCKDCGVKDEAYLMDFDHIRDKSADVSAMISKPINKILAEISKCEVVCVRCHRIRTHKRLQEAA